MAALSCPRRRGLGLLVALSMAVATLAATPALASAVHRDLAVPSAVLGREMRASVYLPTGHGRGEQRFPVVFLLHGRGGNQNDWLDAGRLAPLLDRLIDERAVPPLVVVMPAGEDGWYVDNPDPGGRGLWATAFMDDLVPWIEQRFAGLGRRGGRAIAGLSMGGFGALRFAFSHPDSFVAAASLSGALFSPDEYPDSDPDRLQGAFGTPFDRARMEANNPWHLIPHLVASRERPAIWLAAGDDDGLAFEQNAARMHAALRRAGIKSELRIDQGGHDWEYWARAIEPALRFLGGQLDRPETIPSLLTASASLEQDSGNLRFEASDTSP